MLHVTFENHRTFYLQPQNTSFKRCILFKLYVTVLAAVLFVFPAVIIAICYTVIVLIIWSKGPQMGEPRTLSTNRFSRGTQGNGKHKD